MRKKLIWGDTSYTILHNGKEVLSKTNTACFADFMSRFNHPYDTIRIFDIDCEPTKQYKDFFLQYVIDMFDIEGSFNDDYFEFKSQGIKHKDAAVMSIVRFLWETLGNSDQRIDTPNLLFKRLRDDECPHEDKLMRFLYFYKEMGEVSQYFSEGHSWRPVSTRLRTTKEFKEHEQWTNVNSFFTTI